jgi:hypothetical protein
MDLALAKDSPLTRSVQAIGSILPLPILIAPSLRPGLISDKDTSEHTCRWPRTRPTPRRPGGRDHSPAAGRPRIATPLRPDLISDRDSRRSRVRHPRSCDDASRRAINSGSSMPALGHSSAQPCPTTQTSPGRITLPSWRAFPKSYAGLIETVISQSAFEMPIFR